MRNSLKDLISANARVVRQISFILVGLVLLSNGPTCAAGQSNAPIKMTITVCAPAELAVRAT